MTTGATQRHSLPPPVLAVLLGLGVLVGVLEARASGSLQRLELWAYDACLSLLRVNAGSDPRIALVAVREAEIARYGHPLSDALLAAALERLLDHGPRVIGVDLFRDRPVPPGHERLSRLLRKDGRIVAVMTYPGGQGGGVAPPPAVEDPGRIGFADMVADPDGVVRRGMLFLGGGEQVVWSLALRLAAAYLAREDIWPTGSERDARLLRLGAATYRPLGRSDVGYAGIDAGGYQFLLAYPAGRASFGTLTLQQVLDGDIAPDAVRDRVVVLGTMAESVKDIFPTPLIGEPFQFGAALHGQIASQLIRQALGEMRPIRPVPAPLDAAWTGLWCVLGGLTGLALRSRFALPLGILGGIGVLAASAFGLFALGFWIALVPPLLGFLAALLLQAGYLVRFEHRERAALMRLFATHLSPRIADALWQERHALIEQGEPRPQSLEATVLFSDVRGFTTVSEAMTPSILMAWLNEYVGAMADIVAAYDGVVLELTGDGVLAVFGIPLARTSAAEVALDARNAVRCALAMGAALPGLNASFRARGLPEAVIRVGIHTGPLVAGSLGSPTRRKYAVVGDTVNIAARLESYDKADPYLSSEAVHCRILVSGATYACLGGEHAAELVGKLDLKGKSAPITVHRLLAVPAGRPSRLEKAG